MEKFYDPWGEARNLKSRKLGEPKFVPTEAIPDEGKDPESLLIAREEDRAEQMSRSGGLSVVEEEKTDEPDEGMRNSPGDHRVNLVTRGGTRQSSQFSEGLRRAVAVKDGLGGGVRARRGWESEKRGKGAKLNKPVREREGWKKAA